MCSIVQINDSNNGYSDLYTPIKFKQLIVLNKFDFKSDKKGI